MSTLLPDVLEELQRLLQAPLEDHPLRVDTVWIGHRMPAYTTVHSGHVTCTTTDQTSQGWTAVEIVLHEACHTLARPIRVALDQRIDQPGDLWHAVLFYLAGETVRRALEHTGISYQPFLEATGLFDRVWPQLRRPITEIWTCYLDGHTDWDRACDLLAAAVRE